jgi:N-acetylmuramoyl-L-alanine amidase
MIGPALWPRRPFCRTAPGVFALVVVVFCGLTWGQARLKNEAAGKDAAVSLVSVGDVPYLSLTELAEGLGFKWTWDFFSQKLTCRKKDARISFVQGMPFFLANDSLRQLIREPVRRGGMLYLPASLAAEVFCAGQADAIEWHAEDSTLIVRPKTVSAAVRQPAETAGPAAEAKSKDTVRKARPAQELIKTVVLDPGHGGMDPGAIGPTGVEEKEVVLTIGLALFDIFKKKTKLSVFMTRETDVFIPLNNRTKFANEKKADIFVSIHANSIEGNKKRKDSTRGYKVYFLSQAKNEDDKLVAMRENAVIELEDKRHDYDNLQNILIDMAGNEYLRESQDLSIMITEAFHAGVKKIPRLHLGVGQANFWVLNGAYMPSVLIEVGFISSRQEEDEIRDPSVQKSIASGIFDAIMGFKKKYEEGQ